MPLENAPDDLQMPPPRYGGATDDALYQGNIEQELDNDQIMADYHQGNDDKEDQYAQQQRMRAQQENQLYQQKIGQLEQTVQSQNESLNYMRGQMDTLASTNQQSAQQAAADRQAAADAEALRQFDLSPDQHQLHGEQAEVVDKMIGRALFLQEKKLRAEFNQQLATQTHEAVAPLREQLQETRAQAVNNERAVQNQFDIQLDQQLQSRGIPNLEKLLADPKFQSFGRTRAIGTDKSMLKVMQEAAAGGKVMRVTEVVDQFLERQGYDTTQRAAVPQMGNTPRVASNAEHAAFAKRKAIADDLEKLEYANSVGDYSMFNGSRSEFMKKRNQLLQELENTPLPN